MGLSAVTVLGTDRPGVIAEVAGSLADCGVNIQDSTMTLLGGHVAMMLLVAGDLSAEQLRERMQVGELVVTAAAVEGRRDPCGAGTGLGYVLTLHGPDRPGIISSVSRVLASVGGNITGMSTTLSGRLYVLIADVDLPASVDVADLMRRLAVVGAGLSSEITFRPCESDLL
ncbi:glycine cleavage system protein R [Nonomuraea dietziae]|uniref:glycine cleavage system protein R n=1 Tax=Nonomuraea dietziae TaxID=65515 RepID=UPI0034115A3B